MSVNVFRKGQTPDLLEVATKGYNATWTGTRQAAEQALTSGEIKNGTVVYITDDYNTSDSVVHADTADKALVADNLNANAKLDGKEIALLEGTLKDATVLSENYDLDVLGSGVYKLEMLTQEKHGPKTYRNWSWGNCICNTNGKNKFQLYIDNEEATDVDSARFASNKMYLRTTKLNDTYSQWMKVGGFVQNTTMKNLTGRAKPTLSPHEFFEALVNKGFQNGEVIIFEYAYANDGILTANGVSIKIVGGFLQAGLIESGNWRIKTAYYVGERGEQCSIIARYTDSSSVPTEQYIIIAQGTIPATLQTYNQGITKEI